MTSQYTYRIQWFWYGFWILKMGPVATGINLGQNLGPMGSFEALEAPRVKLMTKTRVFIWFSNNQNRLHSKICPGQNYPHLAFYGVPREINRKFLPTIPNLHTNYHLKHKPESGRSDMWQVVYPWPQIPQGELVANPGKPPMIIVLV